MKERKRRRRERNVEEEEKVEEGKGKRIQSTYREQLLMVFSFFLFYLIRKSFMPSGKEPPFQGGGGERGDNLRFKDGKN